MEKSIKFYNNLSDTEIDRKKLDLEIEKLNKILSEARTKANEKQSLKLSSFTSGVGRKGMIISITLVLTGAFCGATAMYSYTASIFQMTGSNLSPNLSAVVIGLIQLFGNCLVVNLVDHFGRKVNDCHIENETKQNIQV